MTQGERVERDGKLDGPSVQRALDGIRRLFPLGRQYIANDAIDTDQLAPGAIRFPTVLELYGPEPRISDALLGSAAITSYAFPGDALSASTQTLVPDLVDPINVKLAYARWLLVWTPSATGCGVQLIHCDAGPTNITQVAEQTGSASGTPLASALDVTSVLAPIVAAGVRKFVGHRLKGNGAVGPLVFASRVELVFET